MSDTTDTANKLIDVASQKMDAFGTKLDQLAHQYGPDIVNGALQVARIDALNGALAMTIIIANFIFWLVYLFKVLWPWAYKHANDSDGFSYPVALVIPVISLIIFVANINIWPFIGIFEPKLWLAHKLLNL